MKITPPIKSNILSFDETLKFVNQLYGSETDNDFDERCVQNYEIIMNGNKISSLKVIYNKLKITPFGQNPVYWPISEHIYELTEKEMIDAKKKLMDILK